jgi:hypothetical protein
MPSCPSKLCGKENPEGNNYCQYCGIDLKLDEDEIHGRDMFYSIFMEYAKEQNDPEFKGILEMKRGSFDYIIEKNVGRLFLTMAKLIVREKETIDETKKEKIETDLEKEKLKALQEISKSLKKITIKK